MGFSAIFDMGTMVEFGSNDSAVEELKSMSTTDGNLLFWNCHLSESKQEDAVVFPSDED